MDIELLVERFLDEIDEREIDPDVLTIISTDDGVDWLSCEVQDWINDNADDIINEILSNNSLDDIMRKTGYRKEVKLRIKMLTGR